MTVEFKEIEAASDILFEAVKKIPKQIDRLKKEIRLCDEERNDILHLIELESFNASEGYRHARELQITLLQRRKFKDELEALEKFHSKMNKNRTMNEQVDTLHYLVKERTDTLKARTYRPRVREDFNERFIQCKRSKLLKGV